MASVVRVPDGPNPYSVLGYLLIFLTAIVALFLVGLKRGTASVGPIFLLGGIWLFSAVSWSFVTLPGAWVFASNWARTAEPPTLDIARVALNVILFVGTLLVTVGALAFSLIVVPAVLFAEFRHSQRGANHRES
jgi:integral membrane sensor domain MASE1